jgi:hypothetical protein
MVGFTIALGPPSLRLDELVAPGPLNPSDPESEIDRFSYDDVVTELRQLCEQVKTGSNIALFAPWGAGS